MKINLLLLLMIISAVSAAQVVESLTPETVKVTVPLLLLEKNKLRRNQALDSNTVTVKENGEARKILSLTLRNETDPIAFVVLLDTSNSQRDQFEASRRMAIRIVEKAVRPGTDFVSVGAFDTYLTNTNFLSDKSQAIQFLQNARVGGGSAIHDAIYQVCERFTDAKIRRLNVQFFLISDGDDNQSHHTVEETIREAQSVNATIFTIRTGIAPSADKGERVLQKFAQETGGLMFADYRPSDLDSWLDPLVPALRYRPQLSYESPTAATKPKIEISTTLHNVRVAAPVRRP